MSAEIFFFVGLSFILTHELDAIKRHEWRIFPLTSFLDDQWGYWVFTGFHVPLFLGLFWFLHLGNSLNASLMFGLNIFFVVHFILHLLFLRHPKNEFTTIYSWLIIVGAALAGGISLFV